MGAYTCVVQRFVKKMEIPLTNSMSVIVFSSVVLYTNAAENKTSYVTEVQSNRPVFRHLTD